VLFFPIYEVIPISASVFYDILNKRPTPPANVFFLLTDYEAARSRKALKA
jgi:hypothetical protein